MALLSVVMDLVVLSCLACQAGSTRPFQKEQLSVSWSFVAHAVVTAAEAAVQVVVFFCYPQDRKVFLCLLLGIELVHAVTSIRQLSSLTRGRTRESILVGAAYLGLASGKLLLAGLWLSKPDSLELLWAHFFAHHTSTWALVFDMLLRRTELFPERRR